EEERKKRKRDKKRMKELKKDLEEEKNERRKAKKRIGKLKLQLAKYEGSSQEEQATAASNAEETKPAVHFKLPHPSKNFLVLAQSGKSKFKAMRVDTAVEKVRSAFATCDEDILEKMNRKNREFDCGACGVLLFGIISAVKHFLSEGHIKKVRALNAGVPRLAVTIMVGILEKAAKKAEKRAAKRDK
ncbi:hypothetical protein PMAYCL1PPCAC_14541, partial [Pristionchus mayeri]